MAMIEVSIDGVPVGVAQDINWSQKQNSQNYSISANRIVFDKLKITAGFNQALPMAQNQVYPLQLSVKLNNNSVAIITNAWITSCNYNYTSSNYIISTDLELDAESVEIVNQTEIKCEYCVKRPRELTHDVVVRGINQCPTKKLIMTMLNPPDYLMHSIRNVKNIAVMRKETIEILRGHFPDLYNKMESLFVLL